MYSCLSDKINIATFQFKTFISLLLFIAACTLSAEENTYSNKILITEVSGPIGPAISDHVLLGIKNAIDINAELMVLELDTPGGLDIAMRDIIQGIISSPVPIVTYVYPSGARAASAGTYILYASHIAAMSPATTLGAATPVSIGGMPKFPGSPESTEDDNKGDENSENKKPSDNETADAMEKKLVNDAAAYIRALAQLRNRNVAWGEEAVRKASSLTSEEALEQGVIDYIAIDIPNLLEKLDGKLINVLGVDTELKTSNSTIIYHQPDWRNKLLTVITDPNILPILMTLGMLGLIYEMLNPGFLLPGVLGGICILLALYAAQVLPINYAGVALIILGILFIIGEVLVPSFGILGIGGIIAFVIGSIILIDTDFEGYGVSLSFISTFAVVNALFLFFILTLVLKSRGKPVVSGSEELIGAIGKLTGLDDDELRVSVHGEDWKAISKQPIYIGDKVRVVGLEGLTLIVEAENPDKES